MRSLLVFLSLTSLAVASLNAIIPTLNELGLNGSEVEKYFFRQANNVPYGTCNSQKFLYAQTVFNEMLNISSAYTWRNATQITYAVIKIISIKGVDGVVKVCNISTSFAARVLMVGWVHCEKERIGFAYDCNGLVC
uniref:SCP domain-containing protein n=1 Tax=Heterorhabditis bacteriophora TaxID=37862 RepID=A0A1I7X1B7_HETBA